MNNMKKYKKDDKVRVVANETVPNDLNIPFHYYEIGEIVRVTRVTRHVIYCLNSKGLNQALKPTHIEPIKNQ